MSNNYRRYELFVRPLQKKSKELFQYFDKSLEENDIEGNIIKVLLLDMHYFLSEGASDFSLSPKYVGGYLKIQIVLI